MPRTCSVPGCNSGYRGPNENVQTFAFPNDLNLREKWVRAIHRSNDFVVTQNSSVCVLHFHERDIVRVSLRERNKGKAIPLKKPYLVTNAVPAVFRNQPSYMTSGPSKIRQAPEARREAAINRNEAAFEAWQEKDKIKDFQDFSNNYSSKSLSDFKAISFPNFVYFYKINVSLNSVPEISSSVKIFENLKIQAFVGNIPMPSSRFKGMLNRSLECCYWSAFESLLSHLGSLEGTDILTFEASMEELCNVIDRILELWNPTLTNLKSDINSPKLSKLAFFREQVKLMTRKIPRYSSDLILWSCSIFFAFPSAYVMVRNAHVLTLPHPSHLKRLTGDIKCEAGISNEQIAYLKTKCNHLESREKVVNVLFDEIYTVPTVNYKGGKIVGLASNNEGATKIQAFMVTSIFGKFEDIVSLFPVNLTSAEKLKDMTLKVIEVLTKIGFTVLVLISDNNRMNRAMFKLLGEGQVKKSIMNPFKDGYEIFCLFDTVHLMKSVRNNWLNQKNAAQSFYFPLMEDSSIILSANIKDLKDIYIKEKDEILKFAPALSQKVLYPSSFERQNVNIALRLFDEKNVVALEKSSPDGISGTAEFLKIISAWWRIVNVRAPSTGMHKRDEFREPIRSSNDSNLKYLHKFVDFLNTWQKLKVPDVDDNKNSGKLTQDTYSSLLHTTETLLVICEYIFEKLCVDNFTPSFVLMGKFQTDPLESRFGKYRQMSGCNYHVSVTQVMESERKLKLLSLLKLRSEKFGEFEIANLECSEEMEDAGAVNTECFNVCLDASDEVEISEDQGSILYFLGGYCAHLLLKHVANCLDCKKVVIGENEFYVDTHDINSEVKQYLTNLTRGGLKEPTPVLYEVVSTVYKIFVSLISKDFEENFLKSYSQRGLLKQLALKKLEFIIDLEEKCNACGRSTKNILTKVSNTLANIFLNNYVKKINDPVRLTQKRKLDTFVSPKNQRNVEDKKKEKLTDPSDH